VLSDFVGKHLATREDLFPRSAFLDRAARSSCEGLFSPDISGFSGDIAFDTLAAHSRCTCPVPVDDFCFRAKRKGIIDVEVP